MKKIIENNFTETFLEKPDLLEVYSNEVVTIYGLTGPLKDLAKMCPKDLRDPNISVEMKNEFVVKIANESDMAIDPEHEIIFNEVIEKNGLERKFKLSEKPDKKETIESTKEPESQTNNNEIGRVNGNKITNNEPIMLKIIKSEKNTFPNESIIIAKEALKHPLDPEEKSTVMTESSLLLEYVDYDKKVEKKSEDIISTSKNEPLTIIKLIRNQLENTNNKKIPEKDDRKNSMSNSVLTSQKESLKIPNDVNLINYDYAENTFYSEKTVLEYDFSDSETEPIKEPEKIYYEFIEMLENLSPTTSLNNNEVLPDNYMLADLNIKDEPLLELSEQQFSMTTVVASRILELKNEDKELAITIVTEITSTIHDIKLLENKLADSEKIEETKTQLKSKIIELFQLIGMDDDEQIVEQFLEIILKSKFNSAEKNTAEEIVDLEYDGTREARTNIHLKNRNYNEDDKIQQIIGMFVLLWTKISYGFNS